MLTLALILGNGEHLRIEVSQAQFVRDCPYCKLIGRKIVEFLTIDPDQIYCTRSHLVMWSRKTARVNPAVNSTTLKPSRN